MCPRKTSAWSLLLNYTFFVSLWLYGGDRGGFRTRQWWRGLPSWPSGTSPVVAVTGRGSSVDIGQQGRASGVPIFFAIWQKSRHSPLFCWFSEWPFWVLLFRISISCSISKSFLCVHGFPGWQDGVQKEGWVGTPHPRTWLCFSFPS